MENKVIQKTPGVLGGVARIRDTRLAVWMLVRARQLGVSDLELVDSYAPLLNRQDLMAAWNYYQQNQAEIDADLRRNEDD